MIEPIMYIGIGFLVGGLLVLGVIPLVDSRAVRLTMRRLEAMNPLSMAEVQADKDLLRAEFAMSTRRLELSLEQMKAKTTSNLADIGKKTEAISLLKLELGEKTAALLALEAREKLLNEQLQSTQAELAANVSALAEVGQALASVEAELAQVNGQFSDRSLTADSQRVELVALQAQIELLKNQIDGHNKEAKDLRDQLDGKTTEAEQLSQQLGQERGKTEQLGGRLGELDRQLVAQNTESEVLGRRAQELSARLDEQGRFLADREFITDRLRNDALAAQKTEAEVRAELADAEKRHRFVAEAIRSEKAQLDEQLKQSHEERAKLEREIAAMKREFENAGASERMENAVLRERISEVAAEVVRLTAALEGSGSTIDAILASDAGRTSAGPNGSNGNGTPSIAPGAGEPTKSTLADRIRALQGRAARAGQPKRA